MQSVKVTPHWVGKCRGSSHISAASSLVSSWRTLCSLPFVSKPRWLTQVRCDLCCQHGGCGQREHHERRGGLHGRCQDHRQRADTFQASTHHVGCVEPGSRAWVWLCVRHEAGALALTYWFICIIKRNTHVVPDVWVTLCTIKFLKSGQRLVFRINSKSITFLSSKITKSQHHVGSSQDLK